MQWWLCRSKKGDTSRFPYADVIESKLIDLFPFKPNERLAEMATKIKKWEFYKDKRKKWRHRAIGFNNEILKSSSQGYVNKQDCIDNASLPGYRK